MRKAPLLALEIYTMRRVHLKETGYLPIVSMTDIDSGGSKDIKEELRVRTVCSFEWTAGPEEAQHSKPTL